VLKELPASLPGLPGQVLEANLCDDLTRCNHLLIDDATSLEDLGMTRVEVWHGGYLARDVVNLLGIDLKRPVRRCQAVGPVPNLNSVSDGVTA